jgi:hypothetical protein
VVGSETADGSCAYVSIPNAITQGMLAGAGFENRMPVLGDRRWLNGI